MSIEQKIREILSESTEELSEGSMSNKGAGNFTRGHSPDLEGFKQYKTGRNTSVVDKLTDNLIAQGATIGHRTREGYYGPKNADVVFEYGGDEDPTYGGHPDYAHVDPESEHHDMIKKALGGKTGYPFVPEETNMQDYVDDVEQLDEWDGTKKSANKAFRNMVKALDDAENERLNSGYSSAQDLAKKFPGNKKLAGLRDEAKKRADRAQRKYDGARAGIETMHTRQELNQGYEYEGNNLAEVDNMQDYVNALTNGEELTEEFKEKAATIFEAAVVSRVNEELTSIQEAYEAQLEEEVAVITEGLIEKVDGYLDYVVEQWMEQNELALERGMKSEILESFVGGLKSLFEDHNIELPDEKFDVVASMEEKVGELTESLNEQMERNVNLKKEIATYQVAQILSEASEGLVATDKEKFLSLVEDLEFDSVDSFAKKTQIIRENYFTNKPATKTVAKSIVTDSPVYLEEDNKYVVPQMRGYTSVLDKLNK